MHRLCASILLLGSFACREREDATRNPPSAPAPSTIPSVVAVAAPSASVDDEPAPAAAGMLRAGDGGVPKIQWGSAPIDSSHHMWRDTLRDQYGVR